LTEAMVYQPYIYGHTFSHSYTLTPQIATVNFFFCFNTKFPNCQALLQNLKTGSQELTPAIFLLKIKLYRKKQN